jgi:hypothetical protein
LRCDAKYLRWVEPAGQLGVMLRGVGQAGPNLIEIGAEREVCALGMKSSTSRNIIIMQELGDAMHLEVSWVVICRQSSRPHVYVSERST